jgi:hypothetical protein
MNYIQGGFNQNSKRSVSLFIGENADIQDSNKFPLKQDTKIAKQSQ